MSTANADCPKRRRDDNILRHPLAVSLLAGSLAAGGAWYVGAQRESVEQRYMGQQLAEVRGDLKELTGLVRKVEVTLVSVERVQEREAAQWREQSSRNQNLSGRLQSLEGFRDVLIERDGRVPRVGGGR